MGILKNPKNNQSDHEDKSNIQYAKPTLVKDSEQEAV